MNDHVLTSLMNLFALFTSTTELDNEKARNVVTDYLVTFFSIRNYEEYLDLYDNLCDVYELTPPDLEKIIESIASKLTDQITKADQALLVLRFMEFSSQNREEYHKDRDLFALVAKTFNVDEETFLDFERFIDGEKGDNVGIDHIEGTDDTLRVLRLPAFHKVIVAYDGNTPLKMNDMPILPGIFIIWLENGVIKSSKSQPYYFSYVTNLLGGQSRFEAIHMAGRDVDFRFNNSNNGLHNFTFDLHSGEFVAIMGGSGVGKSTLLSILNGSLKPQTGTLTINGFPLYDNIESLKPYIGFVPQDDLLIAELTVFENLYYTAKFCFSNLSEEEIYNRVNQTLSDLGLSYIQNLKVGSPLNKTISGGQRKRLNIALELIREPSILFLDEPTSGLSSTDSEKVIHLLKEQTYHGKLVIVNIHQPSSDIYKLFDRLWLLDVGGYPIYDGNPIDAPAAFKIAANYADAESSICPTCGNINPELVLNIIDERALDSNGEPTGKRKRSPEDWHNIYRSKIGTLETIKDSSLPVSDQCKPTALKQFLIYLQRNVKAKLTDRQFLAIALFEAPLLALIVGYLTRYAGDEGYTLFDNKNLLSYMFMAIIVAIFMGMSVCAEEIFKDRALLKREKFLQLSHGAYISSKIVLAAVIALVQTGLFIIVGNTLLQISGLWWQWWLIMFSASLLAALTGLLLSQTLNSIVSIYITIPLLLIPQILLCGLVVDFDDINQHSKTGNVPWIGELIPSRWSFEALAVTSMTDNDYTINFFEDQASQYEMQITRMGFMHELDIKVKSANIDKKLGVEDWDKHLPLVVNETKKLTKKWDFEPFSDIDKLVSDKFTPDIADKYKEWIHINDSILYRRSMVFTRRIDQMKQILIEELGSTRALVELQTKNCNRQLNNTLIGMDGDKLVRIEEDCLVPCSGHVYLKPQSRNGRAPFYSSKKVLGSMEIPTIWFNLFIVVIMMTFVSLMLYYDYPGKYIRKQ